MRARAAVAAALVTAFVLGVAAGGVREKDVPGEHAGSAAATAANTRGPALPGRAASGNQRSEAGARAAAIAYATASQDWLYLSDEEIDRAVRAIATARAGPSLSRDTVADLGTAREALRRSTGRVWWLVRPLASRVERFEATGALVAVWTVTVLSAADVALPQAEWVRVAVDLAWVEGTWLVEDVMATPGPTPMSRGDERPWEPEHLDRALDGFERVADGAGR